MAKRKFKNIDKKVIKIDKSLKKKQTHKTWAIIRLRQDDSHFDA